MPELDLFPSWFEYDFHAAMKNILPEFYELKYIGTNGHTHHTQAPAGSLRVRLNIDETREEIVHNFPFLQHDKRETKERVIRQFFEKSIMISDPEFYKSYEPMIHWVLGMRYSPKTSKSELFSKYMNMVSDAVKVAKTLVNRPKMREDPRVTKDIECMAKFILQLEKMYRNRDLELDCHEPKARKSP